MAGSGEAYSKGDWLVHPSYGIGQVKKVEKKRIEGEKIEFYRVEGEHSTYWLPVKEPEGSRVRRLATKRQFRKAIKLLKKAPKEMDPDHTQRRSRIKEVMSTGSLNSVVRAIRDLSARNTDNRLSDTERRSLEQFIDSLVEEWAIAEEIEPHEARIELQAMLDGGSSESK
ncbi:MAG: CarD family transcriptional regulator [Anaerolineales bacterium]